MNDTLYQGSLDVFLDGVRAEFNAIEDTALTGIRRLEQYSLLGTETSTNSVFTNVAAADGEGERAVWRHVYTTAVQQNGTRIAGGVYPEVKFLRGYETAVYDPNSQIADRITVPEEREMKEEKVYKSILNRAQKLMEDINYVNIKDPFEVFNLAFTAPTTSGYPSRFFVRGNMGLDGNYTALNERLVSTQHARADGGTVQSNAVTSGGVAQALSADNYYTAKELGGGFVDDVGKYAPAMGGALTVIVPNGNGMVKTAKTINDSEWKVGVADNDINVLNNDLERIIASPFLRQSSYLSSVTNPSQWFLVDTSHRDPAVGTGLVRIEFVPLQSRTERDIYTDSIMYKIKEEYVYGFAMWWNIVGSPGSGAYTS